MPRKPKTMEQARRDADRKRHNYAEKAEAKHGVKRIPGVAPPVTLPGGMIYYRHKLTKRGSQVHLEESEE